jgi:hypothetical protein
MKRSSEGLLEMSTPVKKRVPDFLGVLPGGQVSGIKVKVERGRVSPKQGRFIEDMSKREALAFVARRIEDVTQRLGSVGIEARQKDLFECSQNRSNPIAGGD